MFLYVIFIYCIYHAVAKLDHELINEDNELFVDGLPVLVRNARFVPRKNDFDLDTPGCEIMSLTTLSPFVALFLLKNSGNFLGMGSIIDKARVLTAKKVVEHASYSPDELLALAGRLGPWWGKNSQVKQVDEVFQNDGDLVIAKTNEPFVFNPNVAPVKLPIPTSDNLADDSYAVFGIPRSNANIPGDPAPKTSMYFVSIEEPMKDNAPCLAEVPSYEFNDTYNFCTSSNGTYGWGCIGSPTVTVDTTGRLVQIAVLTQTPTTEKDICHIHTRLTPFTSWIRSHSLMNYKMPGL